MLASSPLGPPAPPPGPTPPPAPPPPPSEEEKKRRAADRKATWISGGFYVAAGAAGGITSWLVNTWAPKTVGKAVEPVVNTATGVGQSAGSRFQEMLINPVSSWVNRVSTGPGDKQEIVTDGRNPAGAIYPAAAAALITVSNEANKLDGRVRGAAESFQTYIAMLQLVCDAARKRIAAGDIRGAARHLAAGLYHDHCLWREFSPQSKNTYARLYLRLYPYFHRLPVGELEAFRKAVHDEAERLSGGKRKGLGEYVDTIVKGLTTRSPAAQFNHPLLLQAPGEMPTIALEGRSGLEHAVNDEDTELELRKALEEHFKKLLEGKTPFERFKIRRQQRRVTKAVLKVVREKMAETGKPLSMEELWRIVQTQLNTDASRRLQNKITAISGGAFLGVGATSGVGKFYLEKAVSPQIMVGLDAVVFTLVGIAMGTAGAYFQDRFNNIARAFGYGGLKKATLGPAIERELLDNQLRAWTIDGRIMGGRYTLIWYSRDLYDAVRSAESAVKADELDVAADFLAGASEFGRRMFFSISPLTDAVDLLFTKLGPHFDCCTEVQRDELIRMVEERVKARGASDRDMDVYHSPFIKGLLMTNVEPRKT